MELAHLTFIHINSQQRGEIPTFYFESEWKTCLRSIYFGVSREHVPENCDFYQGEKAYEFLLQVICGLKSPMIGETEVFGQFKNYVDQIMKDDFFDGQLKQVLIDVRNTAKKIRAKHLVNLGAQSYGSLLRKKLNFNKEIHIIGSGQFVEEIVPWLEKRSDEIYIHCRNTEKAKKSEKLSHLKIMDLNENKDFTGSLIIAAPLNSDDLAPYTKDNTLEEIFDLRGDSQDDPVSSSSKVTSLKSFFDLIENNKSSIASKVENANVEIQICTQQKLASQKLHPFGWDDICA